MKFQRRTEIKKTKEVDKPLLIDSGSTMLNLACTDSIEGAFKAGSIVTLPGGTDSGKTMLIITTLACCANDPRFNEYQLIYDDVESKMNIKIEEMFNEKTKNRIKKPPYGKSNTCQDFESNVLKAMAENKNSCIYILDTPDTLSSDEEIEKAYKQLLKKAKSAEDIDKIKGSYHMERAKSLHKTLRMINNEIENSKSLLIMLQQSRDKIDARFGRKEDTAGGRAPGHYSLHRIWMKKGEKIKLKGSTIGAYHIAQLDKNHYNGKLREAEFPIYNEIGIDNIESIISWLVENEFWKKRTGGIIYAEELELEDRMNGLISSIEEDNLEQDLKNTVQKYWDKKEESLKLNRKKRF